MRVFSRSRSNRGGILFDTQNEFQNHKFCLYFEWINGHQQTKHLLTILGAGINGSFQQLSDFACSIGIKIVFFLPILPALWNAIKQISPHYSATPGGMMQILKENEGDGDHTLLWVPKCLHCYYRGKDLTVKIPEGYEYSEDVASDFITLCEELDAGTHRFTIILNGELPPSTKKIQIKNYARNYEANFRQKVIREKHPRTPMHATSAFLQCVVKDNTILPQVNVLVAESEKGEGNLQKQVDFWRRGGGTRICEQLFGSDCIVKVKSVNSSPSPAGSNSCLTVCYCFSLFVILWALCNGLSPDLSFAKKAIETGFRPVFQADKVAAAREKRRKELRAAQAMPYGGVYYCSKLDYFYIKPKNEKRRCFQNAITANAVLQEHRRKSGLPVQKRRKRGRKRKHA